MAIKGSKFAANFHAQNTSSPSYWEKMEADGFKHLKTEMTGTEGTAVYIKYGEDGSKIIVEDKVSLQGDVVVSDPNQRTMKVYDAEGNFQAEIKNRIAINSGQPVQDIIYYDPQENRIHKTTNQLDSSPNISAQNAEAAKWAGNSKKQAAELKENIKASPKKNPVRSPYPDEAKNINDTYPKERYGNRETYENPKKESPQAQAPKVSSYEDKMEADGFRYVKDYADPKGITMTWVKENADGSKIVVEDTRDKKKDGRDYVDAPQDRVTTIYGADGKPQAIKSYSTLADGTVREGNYYYDSQKDTLHRDSGENKVVKMPSLDQLNAEAKETAKDPAAAVNEVKGKIVMDKNKRKPIESPQSIQNYKEKYPNEKTAETAIKKTTAPAVSKPAQHKM